MVLASGSPRRRSLLDQVGIDYEVVIPDVDETPLPFELPGAMVERVARLKTEAAGKHALPVLAADTAVVWRGRILGKPADEADAAAMLGRLQGEHHTVVTGVAVRTETGTTSCVSSAEVRMAPMTDAEIAWYVGTGEPMDKAGSYGLSGIGGVFVQAVTGEYGTVVGLPLHGAFRLLESVGIELPDGS